MMYKANVTACSDIRTKRSKQSEHHVEFLNVKPWWCVKKPLDFNRLNLLVILTYRVQKLILQNEVNSAVNTYSSLKFSVLFWDSEGSCQFTVIILLVL